MNDKRNVGSSEPTFPVGLIFEAYTLVYDSEVTPRSTNSLKTFWAAQLAQGHAV